MHFGLCLVAILALGATSIHEEEGEEYDDGDEIHPQIDMLLFELDNVIDDDMASIPDDLLYQCQVALLLWSIDGREGNDHPPSTAEDHRNADRLMDKITHTYLTVGGNELDREGFVRDLFSLEEQWIVSAVQYYSFIDYYDHPNNSSDIFKLIEWLVYPHDYVAGFVPMYHLERSYAEQLGFIYVLGRKRHPHSHESLVYFDNDCPSYMELKPLIIGDITGEVPLDPIVA